MRRTSLDWESGAAPQKRLGAEPQRNEIRSHRRSQEDGLCERDRPAQDQSDVTRPPGPGHPRRLVPLLLIGEELVSPALLGAQVHEDIPLEQAGRRAKPARGGDRVLAEVCPDLSGGK